MGNILLIDDEEKLRGLLSRIIRLEGYQVLEAADIKAGMKVLDKEPVDVILCDVKLPDGNGVDLVAGLKAKYPSLEIILLTAYGNIKVQLQKRVLHLEKQVSKQYNFENILGNTPAILDAINMAKKVAATDANVLLLGETGTGKEVFAQAIHNASKRNKYEFVALNCSAFSREILESELFGHKAGAFTGAIKDKKGLMDEAVKGPLFLDEIGEMPTELQAKLLRVLETGEFYKVGETKPSKADVRIIAATNRKLVTEMTAGNFRFS